jgi:hypothetical protein
MKAKLNTEVTIKKITIHTGCRLNHNDESTHLVEVEGHVSHDYLWKTEDQQAFKFELHADADLCDAIAKLIENSLKVTDAQQFPRS